MLSPFIRDIFDIIYANYKHMKQANNLREKMYIMQAKLSKRKGKQIEFYYNQSKVL